MRTLKTSLAIFPIKAIIMATLTKKGYQTVNIHNICSPLYDVICIVICRPYRVNPVTVLIGKENNQLEVLKMTCDKYSFASESESSTETK